MKRTAKILLSFIIITTVFSVVALSSVSAQNTILDNLDDTLAGTELEKGGGDLKPLIGNIIQILLGFLGILAVILILYAGFLWMTAGGDSSKVDKAKQYIINATIGIVIILGAYILTSFIIDTIQTELQ